jgi:uncharacterized membrane protein YeiB
MSSESWPIERQRARTFGRSHTLDFLRGLAIAGVMAIHVSQFEIADDRGIGCTPA